jgi:hypothetical protein
VRERSQALEGGHTLARGTVAEPFPRPGSNFPAMPAVADEAAWRVDLALLREQHRKLRHAVAGLSARDLARPIGARGWTVADQIRGIAFHDTYHAGQIGLLKRLRQAETHR